MLKQRPGEICRVVTFHLVSCLFLYMHRIPFITILAVLTALPAYPQTAATAHGERFTIIQNGKNLGQSEYSTAPVAGGETLHSSGSMQLKDFSYHFDNTVTVDTQGNLVRDQLTGSVHGAKASGNDIRFDTASDATGRSLQINITADGKQSTNTVDRHRNSVLLPDLDPAAYALMVRLALEHPKSAWIIIPKENGIEVPAEYTQAADLTGTLGGQTVTVKHSIVAISAENSLVVELFYTPQGKLLEADLNAQNFYVTRDGFKLSNRPRPVAPPPGPALRQEGVGNQSQEGQSPVQPQR